MTADTAVGGGGGGDDRRPGGDRRRGEGGGYQGSGKGDKDEEKEKKKENPFATMYKGKARSAEEIARLEHEAEERKRQKNRREQNNRKDKFLRLSREHPYNPKLQSLNRNLQKTVKANAKLGMDKSDLLATSTPSVTASTRTPQTTRPVVKANSLNVFRADGKPVTREDVIDCINPIIAEAEINESIRNDDKPQEHSIRLSERREDAYLIEANTPAAMGFYSDAIEKATPQQGAPVLKVFRAGDSPVTRRIVGNVYRSLMSMRGNMHRLFAYGSDGAVTHSQVTQYRETEIPEGGSSMRVYLELDPQAFAWLETQEWVSRMGSIPVRWRGVTISGLSGRYAPTANQYEIRDNLIKSLTESTTAAVANTDGPGTSSSSQQEPTETETTYAAMVSGVKISNSEEAKLLLEVSEASESDYSDNDLDVTLKPRPEPRQRAPTPSGEVAKRSRTPDNSPQKDTDRERKMSHSDTRMDASSDAEREEEGKENHPPN